MPLQNSQSGQIALVILLMVVVLLTVGLSLATRTTQDLFLAQQEADTSRVFNAAESGIEDALSQNFTAISGPQSGSLSLNDASVDYDITPSNQLETILTEGMTVQVELGGAVSGNLDVEWSRTADCAQSASLLASVFSDDGGGMRVRHIAFGPDRTSCPPDQGDNFTQVGDGTGSDGYRHLYQLSLTNDDQFVRITAVYDDTHVRVSDGSLVGTFPNQQYTINSTATNDIGDEQRSIQVTRTLPRAASFMDYALYSGAGISK